MRRRDLLVVVIGASALVPVASLAQQPKVPVVGVLVAGTPDPEFALRLFRLGLQDLGYVEGRNIRIDVRSADGNSERLPELAAELVRQKVDVIATWLTPVVLVAKHATSEIPIVMIGAADPVGMGIVASLARPGGNITGIAGQTAELAGKHVELLREASPGLSRIAALCNATDPFSKPFLEQIQLFGNALGVEIVAIMVGADLELDAAFSTMVAGKIEAVIVQPSLPLERSADLALRNRIPAVSPLAQFPEDGGLMAYSGKAGEGERRAAVFVDKILKGAKPADLPVEQPTRFQLVVNMKTAKALGLTIPQTILGRADEVIE